MVSGYITDSCKSTMMSERPPMSANVTGMSCGAIRSIAIACS